MVAVPSQDVDGLGTRTQRFCLGQSLLLPAEPLAELCGCRDQSMLGHPLLLPCPGDIPLSPHPRALPAGPTHSAPGEGWVHAAIPARPGAEGRVGSRPTGHALLAQTTTWWHQHQKVTCEAIAVASRWASPPCRSSSDCLLQAGCFPGAAAASTAKASRSLMARGGCQTPFPGQQSSELCPPSPVGDGRCPPCTHPHPRLLLPGHLQNGLLCDEHARR